MNMLGERDDFGGRKISEQHLLSTISLLGLIGLRE